MKTVACFQFSRWAAFGIDIHAIKWGYYVSVCRKKENGESEPSRLNFTFLPAIGEKREAGTFHKRWAETSRCIFKAEGAAALKNSSWHSHAAGRAFLRATLNDVFDEGTLLLLEKGSEAVTERSSTLRTNVSTERWRVQSTITAGQQSHSWDSPGTLATAEHNKGSCCWTLFLCFASNEPDFVTFF